MSDYRSMLKVPLIIAAVLVVGRIVAEQVGAPLSFTNVLGVAWLYFIVPVYFGYLIAGMGEAKPYRALFTNLAIFALVTRLMIAPTYSLAYLLNWGAPRFAFDQGGVVGGDTSALMGLLVIPIRNLVIWVIAATLVGMILGSVTIAIRRRAMAPSAA